MRTGRDASSAGAQGKDHVKTQQKGSPLQAKRRGHGLPGSIQTMGNKLLLLKPHRLWHFIMVALWTNVCITFTKARFLSLFLSVLID